MENKGRMYEYPLPKFLQPDLLKELNENIIKRTGCFAFLKTEQVMFAYTAGKIQNARSAFAEYAIGLYVLYHDYGKSLNILLNSDADIHPHNMKSDIAVNHRHVETLVNLFRHSIAHGSFFPQTRIDFLDIIYNPYFLNREHTHTLESLNWERIIQEELSDKDWDKIVKKLVSQADRLYDFLDIWSQRIETDCLAEETRKKFCGQLQKYKVIDYMFCHEYVKVNNLGYRLRSKRDKYEVDELFEQCLQTAFSMFADGRCKTPVALCKKLRIILKQSIDPAETAATKAEELGFGNAELNAKLDKLLEKYSKS